MTFTHETLPTASASAEQPLSAAGAIPLPTLEGLLLEIRQDSQVKPLLYMDEINVPFGGE